MGCSHKEILETLLALPSTHLWPLCCEELECKAVWILKEINKHPKRRTEFLFVVVFIILLTCSHLFLTVQYEYKPRNKTVNQEEWWNLSNSTIILSTLLSEIKNNGKSHTSIPFDFCIFFYVFHYKTCSALKHFVNF